MYTNVKTLLFHSKTDKEAKPGCRTCRYYGEIYSELFNAQYMRNSGSVSVLEIGIREGGAIFAWDRVEIVNKIVGVDSRGGPTRRMYRRACQGSDKCHVETLDAYTDDSCAIRRL